MNPMALIRHIVKKDARRLRLPLAGWAALMAGRGLLGAYLLQAPGLGSDTLDRLAMVDSWLRMIQVVIAYGLAGWIFLEDPAADARAAWLTRPIPGWRLLVAKAAGVGLLVCVLPVVVALPWWLSCGFGWSALATAGATTLFWYACPAALAAALASLTGSYRRFFLYTLLVGLAATTYILVLLALRSSQWPNVLLARTVGARIWVVGAWVLLIGGVTTAHQLTTRRTRSAWVLFLVGVVAVVGPAQLWPWGVIDGRGVTRRTSVPVTGGVSVQSVDAVIAPGRRVPPTPSKPDVLELDFLTSVNRPPDSYARA